MKRSNFGVRIGHGITFLVLVFIVSFTPITTHASTGFFTNLWCNVTELFGFNCETLEVVVETNNTVTDITLLPPAKEYSVTKYTNQTPIYNTVVEDHTTNVTNPTTVIQEQGGHINDNQILDLFSKVINLIKNTKQESSGVSVDLFTKQTDKIYEKSNDSTDNVQENLDTLQTNNAANFSTNLLTVTGNTDIDGNTTVGGDLTVDGAITAGMLNISALASAGALVAPYFTATSTLDVNSFMGNVGIGTTTPNSKLTVVGDIDISAGSAYKYNGANVITASTTLNNYFFGGAGNLTMTGNMNTAIGATVFQQNTTGYSNTAVGFQSMLSNTTGYYNTGFGRASLASNTIGTGNSALGVSALQSNITGSRNNAHGYRALFLNDSGDYNTADGYETLYSNIAGSYNTALGSRAGYDINTATSTGANTVIGYNTGLGIVTGINNTILGANVTGLSSTLSNNIIIADGAGNQRINVNSSGNVGIGTTTPSNKLTVYGDINISDTTTGYKLGNNRILYASTTNFSTLAGIGAGNGLLSDGLYNTALGYQSLYTATSSDNNTAVGYQSLFFNTTGYNNTANGVSALFFNTTGYNNTANGMNALFSNTTGYSNTANGRNTLYSNTTGYDNTANGVNAFFSNTTGSSNTIIGVSALFSNTAGNFNTAIGVNALFSNTTGYDNTANGVNALYSNTTGYDNTALGYSAGRYLTDGSSAASTTDNSLFLGYNTKALTADDQNAIVIGYDANGLGSNTVVLGNDSILTTALKGNVGIGTTTPNSKLTVVDGSGSLIFKNSSQDNLYVSGTNATVVVDAIGSSYPGFLIKVGGTIRGQISAGANPTGVGIYAGGSTNGIDILSDGNVGIGTTTPSNLLHVVRSTDGVVARFTDSNGNCDIDPTSTALICSSDSRLKKNVVAIDNTLQNLMALNPVTFNWSKEDNNTPAHIGFIAQEVEPLFPNLVSTDDRGMKAVAYGNFVPLIVKGIQEQQLLLNGKDGELLDGLSTSTRIINTIKNEDERNAIDAILARVDSGVSVLTDFIATRVTAVRGYFDEVFAKKVQTEELCVSDESGAKTCLNKSQIDTLLNSQVAKPPTQNNVAPVETESIKDDVTSETLSTNPPIIEELVEELPGQDPIEPTVETPVIETEVSEEVVVETPVVETIAEESVVVQ